MFFFKQNEQQKIIFSIAYSGHQFHKKKALIFCLKVSYENT